MADQPKEPHKNGLTIEPLTPEVASGNYSNMAVISNTPNEFFFDFIQIVPNMPQARVQTRVVMAPENAKNLLFALRDSLAKYEAIFGEILHKEPKNPNGGNGFSA